MTEFPKYEDLDDKLQPPRPEAPSAAELSERKGIDVRAGIAPDPWIAERPDPEQVEDEMRAEGILPPDRYLTLNVSGNVVRPVVSDGERGSRILCRNEDMRTLGFTDAELTRLGSQVLAIPFRITLKRFPVDVLGLYYEVDVQYADHYYPFAPVPGTISPQASEQLRAKEKPVTLPDPPFLHTRDVIERVPVLHQWVDNGPRLDVKVEKNTKGYNYETKVSGARTVAEAMALLKEARTALETEYAEAKP